MPDYGFRLVTAADLPMLAEWLRVPQVARWWPDAERQLALIRAERRAAPMRQLIALRGDTPLGYAQCYPAFHWPAPHFAGLPQDSIALDVFGAPAGRGQGGAWLRALGDLLLQDGSTLVIDPAPENLRAIRAYEKAGFSGLRIATDSEGQSVLVMARRR